LDRFGADDYNDRKPIDAEGNKSSPWPEDNYTPPLIVPAFETPHSFQTTPAVYHNESVLSQPLPEYEYFLWRVVW
jgi:hypothetical protein